MKKSYEKKLLKKREKLEKYFGSYYEKRCEYIEKYKGYSILELKKERFFQERDIEILESKNISNQLGITTGFLGLYFALISFVTDNDLKCILIFGGLLGFLAFIIMIVFFESLNINDVLLKMHCQMKIDAINDLIDRKKSK